MGISMRNFTICFLTVLLLINIAVAEDILFSGETLSPGNFLEMGIYKFIMQTDCNLVLYANSKALWNSATNGKGTNCKATLQSDGNLVILSGTVVVWTSNTATGSNNYRLIMQGDGNAVIYGAAMWATNTAQPSKRRLF